MTQAHAIIASCVHPKDTKLSCPVVFEIVFLNTMPVDKNVQDFLV